MTTDDSTNDKKFLPVNIFIDLLKNYNKTKDAMIFVDKFLNDYNKYVVECYQDKYCRDDMFKLDLFKNLISDDNILDNKLIVILLKQFNYFKINMQPINVEINILNRYLDFLLTENYDNLYNNGYKYENMLDKNGKFYLIHPQETKLIRNINRDIIGVKINQKRIIEKNTIPSQLFATFNNQMLSKLRLIKVSDKNSNKFWKKTKLDDQINIFSRKNKVRLDDHENLILLLSVAHDSYPEMIAIISLLRSM